MDAKACLAKYQRRHQLAEEAARNLILLFEDVRDDSSVYKEFADELFTHWQWVAAKATHFGAQVRMVEQADDSWNNLYAHPLTLESATDRLFQWRLSEENDDGR